MSGAFLDTNVVVYAFSADPRAERAEALLAQRCAISVQVLNEFTNVARRKLGMSWAELRSALDAVRTLCPRIMPLDLDVHDGALAVAERFGLSLYDALIVSAAKVAECEVLYSEDLSDGQTIDAVKVVNPFRAS